MEILSSSLRETKNHVPVSGRWGQMATSIWQSRQPNDEDFRGKSSNVGLPPCSRDLPVEGQRAAAVLRCLRTTDDPHCGPH
mmetsp:Transcript_37223/g.73751  ORF Transcript_37223/g.73751 Transcript_37223/m.73751 type:complete len:81 (+) Transcript_37223:118-360(+)